MEVVIGRLEEIKLFRKIEQSGETELVAVYGRRRVGKTYLIRNGFRQPPDFEFTGSHYATLKQHLESFGLALGKVMGNVPLAAPKNWLQAFDMLENYLNPLLKKQRRIIFLDEFPWINTPRSGFLPAFENFWNTWASRQKNLVVVICGSSAAWMIKNVVRNRGGLHNRVTQRIRLLPFNLSETETFLKSRKVNLDRFQLIQLYMAVGGIPQYLKAVEPGESTAQTIDRLCFQKDGFLHEEFSSLYHSLFDNATGHMEIVRTLARKPSGLTRQQIIDTCNLTSGGHATQLLEELSESGFIRPFIPFGKQSKDSIYKLTDEYSLFYLHFIANSRAKTPGSWMKLADKPTWKSWSGYAFESICAKHIQQIKKALGIEGVYTEISAWRQRGTKEDTGTQIDLLIDRQDLCINVCEMKFSTTPFEITKSYAENLRTKLFAFKAASKTRKTLFLTMITSFGVRNADQYPGLVQKTLTMDELFKND
ncbi:MAG: ATPase [Cytophagaceae bacterium SCN 52-12]|nr:MAG: ATPase [Cytophagaceae bacterium SCN 52-12]